MNAADIVALLGLEPLPHEGGQYAVTFSDPHTSAIYYLLDGDDFSALHRLASPEVYHWYAGSPLHIVQLHPDGTATTTVLGPDLAAGQRPQHVVPAGSWQGSSTPGEWALVGTTMSPRFEWGDFELGDRADLTASHPAMQAQIAALTR